MSTTHPDAFNTWYDISLPIVYSSKAYTASVNTDARRIMGGIDILAGTKSSIKWYMLDVDYLSSNQPSVNLSYDTSIFIITIGE